MFVIKIYSYNCILFSCW